MPTGTLMKKNSRHDTAWVRTPATNGPMAEPVAPMPDQMPMAAARLSAGKALLTTERAVANIVPPPTPCTRRATMSWAGLWANPHTADAKTKITIPERKTLRRPTMSASRPTAMIGAAKARR